MIHLCPKEPEVLLVCPCPTTSGLEVTVLRGGGIPLRLYL